VKNLIYFNITDNYIPPKRSSKIILIICLLINIILLALAIVFIALYAHEKKKKKDKRNETNNNSTIITNELSLWNDREPKNKLINFMKKITKETDDYFEDFVPKEERIAVFDFDGTLFQETDPIYLDHKLFMYRVFNDTNYKDKATDKEIAAANYIKGYADNGTLPPLELINAQAMAEVYKDMKIQELYNYTKKYIDQPSDGYNNMKRGEAFYKPMLELIDYLQKNDFKVYVLTGTDTFVSRAIIDGHINIPESQYKRYAKINNNDNKYFKEEIPDDFPFGLLPLSLLKYHLIVKAEAQKRKEEKKKRQEELIRMKQEEARRQRILERERRAYKYNLPQKNNNNHIKKKLQKAWLITNHNKIKNFVKRLI